MCKTVQSIMFLIISVCGFFMTKVTAQEVQPVEKIEKEFIKNSLLTNKKLYKDNTIAGKLDNLFKNYLALGSCGFINLNSEKLSKVTDSISFVPVELRSQVKSIDTTTAEVIDVNGVKMFWYVYNGNEKDSPLDTEKMSKSRFLSAFSSPYDFEKSKVEPSTNFSSWALSRNCSGYINSAVNGSSSFFTVSATAAIKADSRNKASIVLVGGSFISPLDKKFSAGGWEQNLVNLDTWNLYANYKEVIDNAWIMRRFDGVIAKREASTGRNFETDIKLGGNLSFPVASVSAEVNGGLASASKLDVTQFQLLIASDAGSKERDERFFQLPKVSDIIETVKKAGLAPSTENTNKFLIQGRPYSFKQIFYGMPDNICREWVISDTDKSVFSSVDVTVTSQTMDTEDKKSKIPICEFIITGQPKDEIFEQFKKSKNNNSVTFQGKLTNSNPSLEINKQKLELNIKQDMNTSAHPIPQYTLGLTPISPDPRTTFDPKRFTPVWNDITITINDTDSPVKREKNERAFIDSEQVNNCGDIGAFKIQNAEAIVGDDRNFKVTLIPDLALPKAEFEQDQYSEQPCQYQTKITMPLIAGGSVTRSLTLNLKVPKKKTLSPDPQIGTTTPAETVPTTPNQ